MLRQKIKNFHWWTNNWWHNSTNAGPARKFEDFRTALSNWGLPSTNRKRTIATCSQGSLRDQQAAEWLAIHRSRRRKATTFSRINCCRQKATSANYSRKTRSLVTKWMRWGKNSMRPTGYCRKWRRKTMCSPYKSTDYNMKGLNKLKILQKYKHNWL